MSEIRDLRTLRERVEEAFRRAGYPAQHEIARRMFDIEGLKEPTKVQIEDRGRQITRWRKTIRQTGWGIGDANARLLALALGLQDDTFIKDRAAFRKEQEQDLALMQERITALEQEVNDLRKRVS